MSQTSGKIVRINNSEDQEKKTLSAAQKQFNSLIKKIDQQKKLLQSWQNTIPIYRQQAEHEYEPLILTFNERRFTWIQLLDHHHDNPVIKKTDKAKIKYLICNVCEEIFEDMNENEDFKVLFTKYHDEKNYNKQLEQTDERIGELMKNISKNLFNIDMDDDIDVSSPEKFTAHLQEKLRERDEQAQTQQQTQSSSERKKTKRQLAKEAQQQQEAALANKSVQEIYRKLVAALHPDREPNPKEREWKTELMQRVNTAYEKKDLLKLLELQLETEQIDATHLNKIADSRLKHFNKILKEQLTELLHDAAQIENMFKFQLNLPFWEHLTPERLLSHLQHDIRELKTTIKSVEEELELFQDITELKVWLKSFKIPKPTHHNFDDLFDNTFPFRF